MHENLIVVNDIPYFNNAMELIKRYFPKRIPFFDFLYMSICEDLKISGIITYDKHKCKNVDVNV
jgi:hypothetical protein